MEVLPDVLGYPLVLAEEILAKAGWQWSLEETMPSRVPEGFVRKREQAFVLKQSLVSDNKCNLLVGFKVGKEV